MPYKHDYSLLAVLGVVASDWWSHLGPVKKALATIAAVFVVAFSAGGWVALTMSEQRGVPARLSAVEKRSIRDSVRVDAMVADSLAARVESIEAVLWRIDDRTQRIACLLAGNSGPACL